MAENRNPNDDLVLFALLLGVGGVLSWAVWHFFHAHITDGLRWVRWAELWVVQLVKGGDYTVSIPGVRDMTILEWRTWLYHVPVDQIEFEHLKIVTRLAVIPMRIVFAVIVGMMGFACMFVGHGTQYRRSLNLQGLMEEQAKSFPAIKPFLKFDPRDEPARVVGQPISSVLPMFAEALSPEEWLSFNRVPVHANKITDSSVAYQALGKQLGRRWRGPEKLPLHAQGLFAAFALKQLRRRAECEELLNAMSAAWTPKKGLRLSGKIKAKIKKVIKDPKVGGALAKYAHKHAWETTALLKCLSQARSEGGVLAPAEFVWLRGYDRSLWYPLSNLGRQAHHAEASGAMVHYTNELIAGQRIPTPRFEEVIRGYSEYLKSGVGYAIPELQEAG